MIRQGDILFVECKEVDGEEKKDRVVAKGESTGHAHRLRSSEHSVLLAMGAMLYIKALKESFIDHEEHETVTLPSGNWKIIRQREYEPEGWRYVQD